MSSRLLVAALLLGLATIASAQKTDFITLHPAVRYPESIAFQPSTGDYFVGSLVDGSVFKGNIKTNTSHVFLAPGSDGRSQAAGLKLDSRGRLYIAGGGTGKLHIYNSRDGALINVFTTEAGKSIINDIAVSPNGDAYVTDSALPALYRVQDSDGKLEFQNWLPLNGTAVRYQTGYNLNGIVCTPDGRYLIAIQTNTGQLYRIEISSKNISEIRYDGSSLTNGDGIALDGQNLYVARNADKEIVVLHLTADYLEARFTKNYHDASLAFPTAVAKTPGGLLVVNSQLDRIGGAQAPSVPFTLTHLSAD